MKVALRCDASSRSGWGHVKRSMSLAAALRAQGAEPTFLTRPSDVDVPALVRAAGFACQLLEGAIEADRDAFIDAITDAHASARALSALAPDAIVVDHYELGAPWHRLLRQSTGARIAVIDDLADRPLDADLLIDHNPARDHHAKYAGVLERQPQWCCGPAYALLDPVYARQPRRPFHEQVQAVGIFMGATDPGNHSALAWRALREDARWRGPVQIATTRSNPHLAALRLLVQGDPALELQLDLPHLAAFHSAHDLQLGAGGGALWERCALGTPTLALVCVPHQRLSVPLLAEAGVVTGFDAVDDTPTRQAELGRCIARLIDSTAERRRLHERSLALVDGQGAARAAAAILSLPPNRARSLP